MSEAIATKILIVDDQEANLIALHAVLREGKYHIVEARSGEEAVQQAQQTDFAVILLDVQMPTMDGFETARSIRRLPSARLTPIVFLTAKYPRDADALTGYEAGAVDYIIKPLNVDVLRAKVSVFVDLFEAKQEIRRQSEAIHEWEKREQERLLECVRERSEKKYQKLVEGLRDVIVWSIDPDTGRFNFITPHSQRIMGLPLVQIADEKWVWEHYSHADDRERVRAVLGSATAFGACRAIEHRFIRPSGDTIWLHSSVNFDELSDEKKRELSGISIDVTHLKETERALRQSIRVRDEFISIASHELRTPITPLQLQMQGFIRILEQGTLDKVPIDRLKQMLKISDAQVARLARLISQLLDVSRISIGKFALEIEAFNLSDLILGMVDQFRREIEASACSVEIDVAPGIQGSWDRSRIEQAAINLLGNALKYGAGKPVRIRLEQRGQRALLSIQDRGIGIAKGDQARIFERFVRAVSPYHYAGLGLGLYISKQIVELHQGSISVESEVGEGACFLVELPLVTMVSTSAMPLGGHHE